MYVRKNLSTSRTERKVFTEPASAGTGLFLDSDQYEEFEVGDDVPAASDFGIRVSGVSMEPIYVDVYKRQHVMGLSKMHEPFICIVISDISIFFVGLCNKFQRRMEYYLQSIFPGQKNVLYRIFPYAVHARCV